MSESCSGNCAACGSDCGERKAESLLAQLNPKSQVKKVIAVVSGKGGVGKSTVTANWPWRCREKEPVGILDATSPDRRSPRHSAYRSAGGRMHPAYTRP